MMNYFDGYILYIVFICATKNGQYIHLYNLQFISVFQEHEYDGPIATGHSISLMLDLELSLHHSCTSEPIPGRAALCWGCPLKRTETKGA